MVTSMVEAFLSSSGVVLPLEGQSCRTRSEEWGNLALPRLAKEACVSGDSGREHGECGSVVE